MKTYKEYATDLRKEIWRDILRRPDIIREAFGQDRQVAYCYGFKIIHGDHIIIKKIGQPCNNVSYDHKALKLLGRRIYVKAVRGDNQADD